MPASPSQVLTEPILGRTRRLILEHGWNSTAYQILNPGLERWFTPQADAVVGFVKAFRYRVVAGSPVCAAERLGEVVALFEEDTRRAGLHSCYFAADERLALELRQRGPLNRILLGAQPVWEPGRWPGMVAAKASVRAQIHRARNKGVTVAEWDAERATASPELRRCLRDWLETRGLPPLHFLVEPETLARLYDRRTFVAEHDERVTAFLVASPIPRRNGWLIEQTVRDPHAPNGAGELLLDFTMRELARSRSRYVTLGLSPLSRRSGIPPHRTLGGSEPSFAPSGPTVDGSSTSTVWTPTKRSSFPNAGSRSTPSPASNGSASAHCGPSPRPSPARHHRCCSFRRCYGQAAGGASALVVVEPHGPVSYQRFHRAQRHLRPDPVPGPNGRLATRPLSGLLEPVEHGKLQKRIYVARRHDERHRVLVTR